jgi:ADP-heptose:LPS heptosyltransferase
LLIQFLKPLTSSWKIHPLSPHAERLILLNFGGLGDEVLFSPVITALRCTYPQAHITLVVEHRSRAIGPLLPGINALETVTQIANRKALFWQLLQLLRRGRFDVVLSSGSSPFIPVLLWASGIPIRVGYATGKPTDRLLTHAAPLNTHQYAGQMYGDLAQALLGKAIDSTPVLQPDWSTVTPDLLAWWSELPAASGKTVVIHPGVSLLSQQKRILKSWPVDHWLALTQQLLEKGHRVILAGGPDDTGTIKALTDSSNPLPASPNLHVAAGQTRHLTDLAWLLKQADGLICVDSAPMHVAVAINTPVVAMFGPTDSAKLLPPGNARFQAVTVEHLPCQPCLFDHRKNSCDQPVCLEVPVSHMADRIQQVLGQ